MHVQPRYRDGLLSRHSLLNRRLTANRPSKLNMNDYWLPQFPLFNSCCFYECYVTCKVWLASKYYKHIRPALWTEYGKDECSKRQGITVRRGGGGGGGGFLQRRPPPPPPFGFSLVPFLLFCWDYHSLNLPTLCPDTQVSSGRPIYRSN